MEATDRERFERIEAYLMDRMGSEERTRFEALLSADDALREEVAVQRDLVLAVELGGFDRLLRELRPRANGAGRMRTMRPRMLYRLAVAAGFLVLVGTALWWISRPSLDRRLFAEAYMPDPGLPSPMSATHDLIFQDAMVAYKLGDYTEAEEKWVPLLEGDPANDTLRYYVAQAALALGRTGRAIPLLESVAADSTSAFAGAAPWYLFLAHLRDGEVDRAAAVRFTDGDPHAARAASILRRLGR